MMTNFNLEIYQAIFQSKKLTEIFLGQILFNWHYAIVDYTADCTISEPFDLFDKTIVGILLLDECVSIEEIGAILGLNMRQDEELGLYKDQAEYDILRDALDSLVAYDMIEIGFDYDACRLTRIGHRYALKNRKFIEKTKETFSLFYDIISNNHLDAKRHFTAQDPLIQSTGSFAFLNNGKLRQEIAAVQIPEIWNVEKGHFFKNEKVDKLKLFEIKLSITVLYDVETQMNRILAYDARSKKFYPFCSDWLWQHQSVQILEKLALNRPQKHSLPFPSAHTMSLIQKKQAFERVFKEEPQKAIEIAKTAHQDSEWIEVAYFWNHLSAFLPNDADEIWFLLPDYTEQWLKKIQALQLNQPIFVALPNRETQKQVNDLYEQSLNLNASLYLCVTDISDFEVLIIGKNSKSFKINHFKIVINNNNSLSVPFLKTASADKQSLKTRIALTKAYLATHYLQKLKTSLADSAKKYADNSKHLSKSVLLDFEKLDQKATVFMDLKPNAAIEQQIEEVKFIKNNFLNQLKEKHQFKLLETLDKWENEFKNEIFFKLEPLEAFNKKLKSIENELLDDYHTAREIVGRAKKRLEQEIIRLKEEVLSKTYIIDTNIFIYEPLIMNKIHIKHKIALSHKVIDELDKLKKNPNTKENAEKVITIINRQLGKNLRLKTYKSNLNALSVDYRQPSPDNMILSVAYSLRDENPVLLTNDNGLQLKAKSIGIPVISLSELLSLNALDEVPESPESEIKKPEILKQGNAKPPNKAYPPIRKR